MAPRDFQKAPSYLGIMAGKSDAGSFGWMAAGAAVFCLAALIFRRFRWAGFGFKAMVAAGEKWREGRQAGRVQELISGSK